MIALTPDEFAKVRDGIAAAHLFQQAVCPLLKQRHTPLNRDQRQIMEAVRRDVPEAFAIVARITHREHRDPQSTENQPPQQLTDLDKSAFRDELENVSALALPDLACEMTYALGDLPVYHETLTAQPLTSNTAARLMAWAWEAGRRYGLQQALAIIDSTTREFAAGTITALTAVLDAALDLPAEGTARPGPTLATDAERSTAQPFEYPEAAPADPKPN